MYSYGILRIIYEIYAIIIYLYGIPSNTVTNNKQLVHWPYTT